MSLSSNRLVTVTLNLTPTGVPPADFSTLMIMDVSTVIDIQERVREYDNLQDLGIDFASNSSVFLAAELYFSQLPQPSSLTVCRWAHLGSSPILYGGVMNSAAQAVGNFINISDGAFSFSYNGVTFSINGISFAGVNGMSDVAAFVQSAIIADNALLSGLTATFNTHFAKFEIQGVNGANVLGYGGLPTATAFAEFISQPSNNQTITINGTVITFKTSGPVGNQVLIGGTRVATIQNLLAFLQASIDVNLVQLTYSYDGSLSLYMAAVATGTAGNSLTLASNVTSIVLSGATLSGGQGTDISGLLNLSLLEGAEVINGLASEAAVAAIQAAEFLASFYGIISPANQTLDSIHLQIAAFVEADNIPHLYGLTTKDSTAVLSSDTTSIGYLLKQLGYNRTFFQYSTLSVYAAASIFGRMLTVDFTGSNTTIIVMYGDEPGIAPEPLTDSQANALDANNYNYFGTFSNGASIIVNGTMASGIYFDIIQGADWLANAIQTNVFNLLAQQRVPQTDAGNNQIGTVIAAALHQAVVNGFLAPGTWNAAGFGRLKTGQFLPLGYYVFIPGIATQPENLRAERISVPIQIAAKGAGAIQTADIALNYNP